MPTTNDSSVYLLAEELALLAPAVKAAWKNDIVMETSTAFETPAQIDARMKAVNYAQYPQVQKKIDAYVADLKAGKKPTLSLEGFPEEAVGSVLFSIGASGMSYFMEMMIRDPQFGEKPDAMDGVAALSRARHNMLKKNEAVFSSK